MESDRSENDCARRPVESDRSGGVGIVCGMKRGISEVDLSRVQVQLGEPTATIRLARHWLESGTESTSRLVARQRSIDDDLIIGNEIQFCNINGVLAIAAFKALTGARVRKTLRRSIDPLSWM